jgi:predicted CoA-substrate-specific enzyme activase
MIFAGIDIGSNTAKAALVEDRAILGVRVIPTGYHHLKAGTRVFRDLLQQAGLYRSDIRAVVATGYGRASIDFADKAMTEILCHGAGAHFLNPDIRGVIDVGGQDSKAIALDDQGRVDNFAMNDKCAAGTGRFLEVMANALEVTLDRMGDVGLTADRPSKISSICTVFAESEVISMIARQEKRENIIAGIHQAAAARVGSLAAKIRIRGPVMMTGGVAKNKGMAAALETQLKQPLVISPHCQETGAIGAAVLASRL